MTSTASVARLPLERGPVALIEECLRVLTFLLPQGFQGHRFPARDLTACARRTSSPILPNLGFRHAPVTAARMERVHHLRNGSATECGAIEIPQPLGGLAKLDATAAADGFISPARLL